MSATPIRALRPSGRDAVHELGSGRDDVHGHGSGRDDVHEHEPSEGGKPCGGTCDVLHNRRFLLGAR